MRFDLDDLAVGAQINEGGQGRLFALDNESAVASRVGLSSAIYKEFKDPRSIAGLKLESLSRLREKLPAAERQQLDGITVWPAAVVIDASGTARGYVMQRLPREFWYPNPADGSLSPREGQLLVMKDRFAVQLGLEIPSTRDRIEICRAMADGYSLLHHHDLVFGDLSGRNFAYRLAPSAAICFMDCDAIRRKGEQPAVPQATTPMWDHPERGGQNFATDRYKLGLFILRCLTPEQGSQNRDPSTAKGVLDLAGLALLERAVGSEPSNRPHAHEWATYLRNEAAKAPKPKPSWKPPPAMAGGRARVGSTKKPALRLPAPGPAQPPGPVPPGNLGPGAAPPATQRRHRQRGPRSRLRAIGILFAVAIVAGLGATRLLASSPTAAPVPLIRLVSLSTSEHETTTQLRDNSTMEVQFGSIHNTNVAGSVPLYECMFGDDFFTSLREDCEGTQRVRRLGFIAATPPEDRPSTALYRCTVTATGEHFDSTDANCEGQTLESLLGYVGSQFALIRAVNPSTGAHQSTISPPGVGWSIEGLTGVLAPPTETSTNALFGCRVGDDFFTSLDPACEGQILVQPLGQLYPAPPDNRSSVPLYRCLVNGSDGHFDSSDPRCEGQRQERLLGYLLRSGAA